jgi:quinol monooxygenase YgiN
VLVRLVHVTVRPDAVAPFLDRFNESAPKIRAFPGCRRLELWRDPDAPTAFTALSHWKDLHALDAFRESELFASTWAAVTPLCADRPRVHSYRVARSAAAIDPSPSSPDSQA